MKNNVTINNLTFSPLISTKYDMNYFINREKELSIVSKAIINNQNILILGRRGSGKTSLLNKILYNNLTNKDVLFIQISLEILKNDPLELIQLFMLQLNKSLQNKPSEKIKKLLKSINYNISMFGLNLSNKNSELIESNYDLLDKFQETLLKLWEKGLKIVFLVDNLYINTEAFVIFFSQLRDYLWRTKAIFVVTCDLEMEDIYLKPPIESFFEIIVRLEPFTFKNIKDLLLARIKNKPLSDKYIEYIYQNSHGNPYHVIKFVLDVLNKNLTLEELKKVANNNIEILNNITSLEKPIIEYLFYHGSASASDLKFQKIINVSRTRLTQILLELKKKGIVNHFRNGRKKYYKIKNQYDK